MSDGKKYNVPLALLAGLAIGTNPHFKFFSVGQPAEGSPAPAANYALVNPSGPLSGRLGAESPELRTLRLAELDLFKTDPIQSILAEAPVDAADGDCEGEACDDPSPQRFSSYGDGVEQDDFVAELIEGDLPVGKSPAVRKYIKYFTSDAKGRKIFTAWLRRSGKYQAIVAEALTKRGLPKDLAAITFIESGNWPTARSSAGAVGLWQFMPHTARAYGLTVSESYDERMGIWSSTDAAAEHLEDLHERFQSWELALAAYNLGYKGLERRLKEQGVEDFWSLAEVEGAMPRETKLYVPKVLAVAAILNNLETFGFQSVELNDPVDAAALEVPPGVPLSTLARAAGTSVRRLREYNPALRGATTPDRGSPVLVHVPRSGLARARVMLPKLVGPEHDFRVVVSEDFDWGKDEISDEGKSRLEKTAPPSKDLLKTEVPATEQHSTLLRPLSSPAKDQGAAPSVFATTARATAGVALLEPVNVVAPASSRPQDALTALLYRVAAGDTLSNIAASFGHSYEELATRNKLDNPSFIMSGQFLEMAKPERFGHQRGRLYYRVQAGETLEQVRERFGMEPVRLTRHRRSSPDALRLGELLRMEHAETSSDG